MPLQSYANVRAPGAFSEELLERILTGVSAQKYADTVLDAARAFGVPPSSVSRRLVELTATKLTAFHTRSLADFKPFAVFLDTIHRGGEAFLVALGMDVSGQKMALGFWHGSSENHEIGEARFRDLERRGLALSRRILFVTDGGSACAKLCGSGSAKSSYNNAAPFRRAGTCSGTWTRRIGPRCIGGLCWP
jgi:putative transposase